MEQKFVTEVAVRNIGPIFKGQAAHCLTLENGTNRLFRNVGSRPPFYAVQNPRPAKISWHYLLRDKTVHSGDMLRSAVEHSHAHISHTHTHTHTHI